MREPFLEVFTSCVQDVIIFKVNFGAKFINVAGKLLRHLHFGDDIIPHSDCGVEMHNAVHTESQPLGINTHLGKTKATF